MNDTNGQRHLIGDIVFCVKVRTATVTPMVIVEINTKTTVNGVVTTYLAIDRPSIERATTAPLDPYKEFDEVHVSAEDAYVAIVNRFEAAIRKAVDQAVEKAKSLRVNENKNDQ